MTSTPRPRFHYAWTVLAAVGFVLLTGGGVRAAIGVFIQPMEAEFGWPRTTLSAAVALSLVLYGAAGPVMGRLADRWGPRGILTVGALLVGLGTAGAALIQTTWQLFLTLGVVAAIGAGAAAAPVAATAVTRWFETRRGLVLGIIGAGMAAGQLLVLPLAMALASFLGWRQTNLVLGMGLIVLTVPVAWALIRNDPAERGLRPFGAAGSGMPVPAGVATEAAERTPLSEAVRTWPFILLAGSFWVCGYTTFGLMLAHFIPHATEHGFGPAQAAQALGIMGGMNIVGTIVSGWLCDRYGPKLPLALYYLFRGLSLFCLPLISSTPALFAFAAVFGLNFISTVPATTTLTARIYGRFSVGELSGWIFASHQIGAAVGSLLSGWLYDRAGDYTLAFQLGGGWAILAALMVMAIKDQPLARGPASPGRVPRTATA
jgi:MFS family permease